MSDSKDGMISAMTVPAKGLAAQWIPQRVATWIDACGDGKVRLKFDNENPIKALAEVVRKHREAGSTTVFESPEEGESQSNQTVEGAVGIAKGMIRTIKAATDANLKTELAPGHPLILWFVEHALQMRNRFR